jgi:hypothetical protein
LSAYPNRNKPKQGSGFVYITHHRRGQKMKMATTDDAEASVVLAAVRHCAKGWVPEARIIGNVRAGDIVRSLEEYADKLAVCQVENERLRESAKHDGEQIMYEMGERKDMEAGLRESERGFDMLHKALMDPSRPRQSIGEICATWLERTRAALPRP